MADVIDFVPNEPEKGSPHWFRMKHSDMMKPAREAPPLEPLPVLTRAQQRWLRKKSPCLVLDYKCIRGLRSVGVPEDTIRAALTIAKHSNWTLADIVAKALDLFEGLAGSEYINDPDLHGNRR